MHSVLSFLCSSRAALVQFSSSHPLLSSSSFVAVLFPLSNIYVRNSFDDYIWILWFLCEISDENGNRTKEKPGNVQTQTNTCKLNRPNALSEKFCMQTAPDRNHHNLFSSTYLHKHSCTSIKYLRISAIEGTLKWKLSPDNVIKFDLKCQRFTRKLYTCTEYCSSCLHTVTQLVFFRLRKRVRVSVMKCE